MGKEENVLIQQGYMKFYQGHSVMDDGCWGMKSKEANLWRNGKIQKIYVHEIFVRWLLRNREYLPKFTSLYDAMRDEHWTMATWYERKYVGNQLKRTHTIKFEIFCSG